MKNLFYLCGLALALTVPNAVAQPSDIDETALFQARDLMLEGAAAAHGDGFDYDGVTPFSMAFIARGSYSSLKTRLEKGVSYYVVGVGDYDSNDIDVIVQDSAGNLIAQDVTAQRVALASFTPRYGGNYTIFLKLHSSDAGVSACALSIFRNRGGYVLSPDSVRRTTSAFFSAISESRREFGTLYNDGAGQWAIVGNILEPNGSSVHAGIPTKEALYTFFAVGDEDMIDLDMRVRDVKGKLLLQDDDEENFAVCATKFNSRQTVSLELINAKSANFSLVMHAILHN